MTLWYIKLDTKTVSSFFFRNWFSSTLEIMLLQYLCGEKLF